MTKVYELLQVRVSGRYPVRDSYDRSLGIYSSLGKAYEAMQTSIKKEKGWVTLSEILCYIIYEKRLDARPYAEEVFIHTYTREGNLNDEWFVADEDDEEQINLKPYYGCPKEKIRLDNRLLDSLAGAAKPGSRTAADRAPGAEERRFGKPRHAVYPAHGITR